MIVLGLAGPALAQTPGGWKRVEIPATGSYCLRYVPFNQDPGPMPVVLFLHGAGGAPEGYTGAVRAAAEQARVVLVLPKSTTDLGWGVGEDEKTVDEALRLVAEELPVDRRHVGIAGHSAGGAYAYLLAYLRRSRYSAVFTLAASSYPVAALADPDYRAPIRMYYGTLDPNYVNGPYTSLKAQWNRLGVPWEEDIQAGYNHGSWPPASMVDGFRFLAAQAYPANGCVPGPTALCLLNGRFRAEVTWKDFSGATGPGHAAATSADGSGLFWFFAPDNWELMVKALDGCAANGHFWVFAAATTSLEYTLTVTDTRTGQTVPYTNTAGQPAPAVTDTAAFTCP